VFGVSVANLHVLAKKLGRDHALAAALWATGWYEARMLATFVDDPAQVTLAQMDAWAAEFDNWAICDTACFHLFDRSPLAFRAAKRWARAQPEFVKRAAFALMASLPHHDRSAPDKAFLPFLPLIEKGAQDERNFVKKAVSWALRAIGRRSPRLNAAAVPIARRLAASSNPAARWVGRDAFRELTSPAVRRQLGRKRT
jgi:3-methyladenine DNA glycosylase AlkD